MTVIEITRDGETTPVARWHENLTSAHYVWEKAGLDITKLDGWRSGECAPLIREVIGYILEDPQAYISAAGYHDMRATVANLTGLFFTLRECPDGIVRVLR